METNIRQLTDSYIHARHRHPAWQLLASRRAPLILSCLQSLFEQSHDGIAFEDALQSLAGLLATHANNAEFEIRDTEYVAQARKEFRDWIKRELIIEREGRLHATDALEKALGFVGALEGRIMTSTASRLSMVQQEIENLESRLNPDPERRTQHIRSKLAQLETELAAVQAGDIDVPGEAEAIERIQGIYSLATSLRADFRRVEDSWREADRRLRQSIINEQNHRGVVVDALLDGHDTLLQTVEGRVFQGFQQQLEQSLELELMKQRLRTILKHPLVDRALEWRQQAELRWLVMRLVKESAAVIRARARSERDVKGFLKTGLAAEHHRVGALLNEIFQQALNMDWASAGLRHKACPLPPIAIANGSLAVVERLRFKSIDQEERQALELRRQTVDLNQIDADFWLSFDGLDRQALLRDTLALLQSSGQPMGISDLARHLPPTHDLETITFWLSMVREADIAIGDTRESIDVTDRDGTRLRFHVPKVSLSSAALNGIEWEV